MSPLAAHNQALAELKLQDLLNKADEAYLRFEENKQKELRQWQYLHIRATGSKYKPRIYGAIILSILIFGIGGSSDRPSVIRNISIPLGILTLLSILISLVKISNEKRTRKLLPLEAFEINLNGQNSIANGTLKSDLQGIRKELNQLPNSVLSDDTNFRNLVDSLLQEES